MFQFDHWLQDAAPPNSYKIQIAYVDTSERYVSGKLSADDSYLYEDLRWMDMVDRFQNYAQANVYALKKYDRVLYRIAGSNDEPNLYTYDHYKSITSKQMTPKFKNYIELMNKIHRRI